LQKIIDIMKIIFHWNKILSVKLCLQWQIILLDLLAMSTSIFGLILPLWIWLVFPTNCATFSWPKWRTFGPMIIGICLMLLFPASRMWLRWLQRLSSQLVAERTGLFGALFPRAPFLRKTLISSCFLKLIPLTRLS